MSDFRLSDETYRCTTPGLDAPVRDAPARQNLASLDRKVTYCLERPNERIQFQRVEGWTTGRIIGYMQGRGLDPVRIGADLARAEHRESERSATAGSSE